ncbi:hypothetical protein [Parenemella sanctibonifatiensis]|uniref:hypothetical protein n=1 Tax=Parenemella sanctibonifatiensis TaxID=2016505 RepID=UPI001E56050F|nr:hypothetical protein [Parenemella sanctibonifatiensis]
MTSNSAASGTPAARDSKRPATRARLRRWGNLLNGSTGLGLLTAKLGGATLEKGPAGLHLAQGYALPFPIAGAFTIGNVIITSRQWTDFGSRWPTVMQHEERHSWQWLLWGGPAGFLPAYTVAMGWSWLRTGDRAAANVFETLADLDLGGYRKVKPRWQGVRRLLTRTRLR